jgi:hypothetical protein
MRPTWKCPGRRDDRGQSTPLVALVLALVIVVLTALAPMGRALARRTQARTAADAAALAGAAEGEEAAGHLAGANGGELLEFRRGATGEVVVHVRVGDVDAWARAQGRRVAAPEAGGGALAGEGSTGSRAGLAAAMLAALARADELLGHPVPVASGLRTRAQQQALWDRRHANPYPVARPGTSDHERGLAIDVPRAAVDDVLPVAEASGLCRPLPQSDPVHFVVCGT